MSCYNKHSPDLSGFTLGKVYFSLLSQTKSMSDRKPPKWDFERVRVLSSFDLVLLFLWEQGKERASIVRTFHRAVEMECIRATHIPASGSSSSVAQTVVGGGCKMLSSLQRKRPWGEEHLGVSTVPLTPISSALPLLHASNGHSGSLQM